MPVRRHRSSKKKRSTPKKRRSTRTSKRKPVRRRTTSCPKRTRSYCRNKVTGHVYKRKGRCEPGYNRECLEYDNFPEEYNNALTMEEQIERSLSKQHEHPGYRNVSFSKTSQHPFRYGRFGSKEYVPVDPGPIGPKTWLPGFGPSQIRRRPSSEYGRFMPVEVECKTMPAAQSTERRGLFKKTPGARESTSSTGEPLSLSVDCSSGTCRIR